jgi:hypothetical protein
LWKYLQKNNTINYLDTSIHRNNKNLDIGIYRKPTETGTVIQLISNHPHEKKMSAFNYYINKSITLPVTEKSKQEECKTILAIAKDNRYPNDMICNLKTKLITKKTEPTTRE